MENELPMEIKSELIDMPTTKSKSVKRARLASKKNAPAESPDNAEDAADVNEDDSTLQQSTHIYACSECPRKFRLIQHFRLHMRKTHSKSPNLKVNCPHPNCNRVFNTPYLLNKHSAIHLPISTNKNFACTYCDKKFISETRVQRHIKFIHMDVPSFICEECGVAVRTNAALKEHMLTHTDFAP